MNLREIRLERGLSVPKLVELSSVPRRTIQEIETGMTAGFPPPSSWLTPLVLPWTNCVR